MPLSLSETSLLIAESLRDHDVRAMRRINDRCIEETALRFQQPTYLFALISYVLSKILTKPRYIKAAGGKAKMAQIASLLRACERQAASADYSSLIATQEKVLSTMQKMDEADRRFTKSILQKGKLKIASTLYAQGLSLGNASEITGTDPRELLSYAGQTMMFDRLQEKKSIEARMRDLREIFSK